MSKKIITSVLALAFSLVLVAAISTTALIPKTSAVEAPSGIRVVGLVKKPLNFTYTELLTFPLVSEVATLECVDHSWKITLNWTGVPLFHLLALAQVEKDAYDVVFRASDGYSSSITVGEALRPTTILALKANGTVLSEISGREGGFRVVIPGKWGYKWVSDVEEIKVVDYDYKGYWEEAGLSDEADMPGFVQPPITPPLQVLETSSGQKKAEVQIFTNVSTTFSSIDYFQKKIILNITVQPGASGFADFIMPEDSLWGPYSILLDGETVDFAEAEAANVILLYLTFPEGSHSVEIAYSGSSGIAPWVLVEFNETAYVEEPVVFDASKSVDDGRIVTCFWDFGDGTSESNIVVSHSYVREGTYKVLLRLTDNEGLSNSTELTVTIQNKLEPAGNVSQNNNSEKTLESLAIVGVVFAAITIALTVTLIIFSQKRKTHQVNSQAKNG
jgi:hypothetical protein